MDVVFHDELVRQHHAERLASAEHDRLARHARGGEPASWAERLKGHDWIAIQRGRAEWLEWQEMYCRLVLVTGRQGFHVARDSEVGQWVSQQRLAHRAGSLHKKRLGLLERLPGWSWEASKTEALRSVLHEPSPSRWGTRRLSAWAEPLFAGPVGWREVDLVRVVR